MVDVASENVLSLTACSMYMQMLCYKYIYIHKASFWPKKLDITEKFRKLVACKTDNSVLLETICNT